jgi:hypothetical protein
MKHLSVSVRECDDQLILTPTGTMTNYEAVTSFDVEGGNITALLHETDLSLSAALIAPQSDTITLHYKIAEADKDFSYPLAAFVPRITRFTLAADELAKFSREIARNAGGGAAGIAAIVRATEARFKYDHPETRFNDGMDAVPLLSCGLTPGSCVDINTYLVASLRSAGYEAAYFYGYFFPEERGGFTDDGHCWVVTHHDGEFLEWDIAHHMKAGLGSTQPGLNPRPGKRVAVTHSMGQHYRGMGMNCEVKVLGEPMRFKGPNKLSYVSLAAHLI